MRNINIAVIGGGASGIYFAIACKNLLPASKIKIFEKQNRPLKKLKASGNGRSNLSNEKIDLKFYNTESEIIKKAITAYGVKELKNFYKDLNLPLISVDGRIYPQTESSDTVVRTLLNTCQSLGIEVSTNATVKNLNLEIFDYVILATGSNAGTMGLSDGYDLCKNIKINPLFPSLVGIIVKNKRFEKIQGVRATAKLNLIINKKNIYCETGEIQFTKTGISGIPSLQASHFLTSENLKNATVILDFFPNEDKNELKNIVINIKSKLKTLPLFSILDSMLNHKLAVYIMKEAKIICKNRNISDIRDGEIDNLIKTLKNFKLEIKELKDFNSAQCVKGGIDLSEINDDFSLKSNNKIFAIGEILDVNGMCGGYNLQFAFSSAMTVAKEIKNRNDKN